MKCMEVRHWPASPKGSQKPQKVTLVGSRFLSSTTDFEAQRLSGTFVNIQIATLL